jgi:hypothetical protein
MVMEWWIGWGLDGETSLFEVMKSLEFTEEGGVEDVVEVERGWEGEEQEQWKGILSGEVFSSTEALQQHVGLGVFVAGSVTS